jgi:hypothetical protein
MFYQICLTLYSDKIKRRRKDNNDRLHSIFHMGLLVSFEL